MHVNGYGEIRIVLKLGIGADHVMYCIIELMKNWPNGNLCPNSHKKIVTKIMHKYLSQKKNRTN